MSSAATGSGRWVERAEAALAQAGRKRGGARRAMLELLDGQRCALSAVQIEEALRRGERRGVSRASVYRILDELERLRLVQRVETGQAMVRYERVCDSHEHHHHLVCDECGLVMPFSDAGLERAIEKLSGEVPLAVSEHEIVLHGRVATVRPRLGRRAAPQVARHAAEREHGDDQQDRAGVLAERPTTPAVSPPASAASHAGSSPTGASSRLRRRRPTAE